MAIAHTLRDVSRLARILRLRVSMTLDPNVLSVQSPAFRRGVKPTLS